MLPPITSTANAEVRRLTSLARARDRRSQQRFVIEGQRAIAGMLASGRQPEQILFDQKKSELVAADWPEQLCRPVSAAVIEKISHQNTPPGVLAEYAIPAQPTIDAALGGLVCDGVADPGNLGTLIRSAAAFGMTQVWCRGGADPYGPKVVQATGGCLGHVTIVQADALNVSPLPLVGLVVDGGAPITAVSWPCWLVVGGEANGISHELRAQCQHLATLAMPGGSESLNAGVAGSIAAYVVRGLHQS